MDIKDLLGNVPFNFQELNLPTPLNQSSIDAIENEEYDMSQHKVKGLQIFNPFARAKAVKDARKGKKKFEEEKQRRLQEEQEKGNAMTMGLNALSAMIQGNQQEQQYNSIPPDNLTPVQGSFGFSHGGSINQPFYGKSGYLDKVAQETMQDIDSEPTTTKRGAKEKMKRAESIDLYTRTSAIKGPNGLENNPYFNKTGYTPGTESMNNPYNIIPGQEITMENTPFPVQGIPINEFGEPVGQAIMMEPGGFYRFPNAFGVLELPNMKYGGTNMEYGGNTEDPIEKEDSKNVKKGENKVKTYDDMLQMLTIGEGTTGLEGYNTLFGNNLLDLEEKYGKKNLQEFTIQEIYDEVMPDLVEASRGKISEKINGVVRNDWYYKKGTNYDKSQAITPEELEELTEEERKKYFQKGTSALGKGQWKKSTLQQLVNKLGIDPNSKFTREIQDKLFKQTLLDKAAYKDFLKSDGSQKSKERALRRLSQEWASVPSPSGKSYYGQPVQKTPQDMYAQMEKDYYSQVFSAGETLPQVTVTANRYNLLNPGKLIQSVGNQYIPFSIRAPQQYGGMINRYQMGGAVQNEMSPVQTEKGEMVTTPDMTTTKTLATKRHSQMTDDEVTDVLPVGSMIWSNDPQMAFTRNEYIAGRKLEDMVIGTTPMYYSETEPMLPQEDIKLLDGFTKKGKFTPADFAKSVKRRMPITDRTHDAFSELAKRENRAHRAEYLIPFAEISMYKKDAVEITEGLDRQESKPKFQMGGALLGSGGAGMRKLMQRTYGMAPENQQPINPLEAMMSKRDNAAKAYDPNTFSQSALAGMMKNLGGIGTISPITSFNFGSMSNIKPQKAQFSEVAGAAAEAGGGQDPISAIAGFATGLMDFGLGIYDRATNAKRYKQTIKEIKQAELDNRANINNAANIGAAGTLANYALQDPSYTYLNLDDVISSNETAYSDALKRIAAERQATMQMNQASANAAALNPNLGYNKLASIQANIAAMNNQAGLQYSQLATNTMLRGNAMRNRYLETLARDRQIGPMHSRQNRNALNQGLSQGLMNTYMGREQGIMDNRNAALSARMGARNQQANYNVQSGQRMSNALSTAGYYGSQINWGNNNPGSSAQ